MKCFSLITLFLAPPFFSCPSLLWAQRGPTSSSRSGVSMEIGIQVRNADGTAGPRGIHVRLEAAEGGSADDCVTEQGGKCNRLLSLLRKSTRLNSSHVAISYAVFCLKKKKTLRNSYTF